MAQSKLNLLSKVLENGQKSTKIGVVVILLLAVLLKLQFLAIVALILAVLLYNPEFGSLIRQYVKSIKWGDKEVEIRDLGDSTESVREDELGAKTDMPHKAMEAFERGNEFLWSDRLQEAIKEYDKAIKIDRDFSNAYINW